MTTKTAMPKDGECAKCQLLLAKGACGFQVVEGRGRCLHDGKPVGLGEGFVSPFQYAEGEERE